MVFSLPISRSMRMYSFSLDLEESVRAILSYPNLGLKGGLSAFLPNTKSIDSRTYVLPVFEGP